MVLCLLWGNSSGFIWPPREFGSLWWVLKVKSPTQNVVGSCWILKRDPKRGFSSFDLSSSKDFMKRKHHGFGGALPYLPKSWKTHWAHP